MSGLLSTVVIIGVAFIFLIKRCVILPELCTPAAVAAAPPTDQAAIDAAIAAGIAAGLGPNAIDPATGLTKAQRDAQDEHLKDRGQAGNEAQRKDIEARQSKTSDADVQKAKVSVCASDRCKKNPKDFICVQSGCHNSVIKDLTKNVTNVTKPKDASGCAAGKTKSCISAGPGNPHGPPGTIVCTCSNYTRVISNYTNRNYIPSMSTSSRFSRVAI